MLADLLSACDVMGLVIEQKDPMRCVPAAAIISLRPHAEPGHGAIAAVRPDLIWITLALHWGDTGGEHLQLRDVKVCQ